ncbi:hypothetical protein KI387_039221, partial [Taxus chinensis]
EKTVREVEEILRELILSLGDLSLDDLFPALRVFYRKLVGTDAGDAAPPGGSNRRTH